MFGLGQYLLVYSMFPSEESAAHVASEVINKKLAACANLLPGARSFYWWDGQVQDNRETCMVLKTTKAQWKALEMEIRTLHPYDIPGIVALPIESGNEDYLNWIAKETKL